MGEKERGQGEPDLRGYRCRCRERRREKGATCRQSAVAVVPDYRTPFRLLYRLLRLWQTVVTPEFPARTTNAVNEQERRLVVVNENDA